MKVRAADLFCGGGGTSTGLVKAADRLGRTVDLLAVNHWEQAIATHKLNHPGVRHYQGDLEAIDPRKAVPEGSLDLLVASPECTSHSYSRGGRPISEQSRATAWCPLKWCDQLNVRSFLIENVPQFRQWGPTDRRGKTIEARKGETYRQWLDMFRALGYTVEARVLNAADYGGATTRRRLFVLGQKGTRRIRWPEATHAPADSLLPGRQAWRAAREIIDWTLAGESIFTRARPLALSTRRRILMGLEKFGGPELRPYLTILRNHMFAQSVDAPVPTVAASGQHLGIAQPVLVHVNHRDASARVESVDAPLSTVTAKRGLALVEPFLLPQRTFENVTVDSVDAPMRTITTKMVPSLVEPFLLPMGTFENRGADSVADPMRTLTTKMQPSLVEPVLTDGQGHEERAGRPFIVAMMGERPGQTPRVHDVDEPFPTVMSGGGGSRGLADAWLHKYSRTGGPRSVEKPLDTLTAKDRYGLVTAHGLKLSDSMYLDIRFRMLRPHELAAAMGFPAGYQFAGGVDDQVRQIGNAVEVHQAEALCFALLA